MRTLFFKISFICLALATHFAQAKSVTREWAKMQGAELYEYEVSKQDNFKSENLLKTGSTRDASFQINLDPGVYFYRIRALTKAGQASPWSSAERIFVKGPSLTTVTPTKNEVIEVPEVGPELVFEWKTVIGAQYYVLRLQNGKVRTSHKVFVPRVVVPLQQQGGYTYQIEAYNGVHPISQSESTPFTLKFAKTPPPRILEPRDTHVLPAYEPFPLRWVQLAPTRFTEVSVTRLDEEKNVLSVEKIKDSEKHEIQALDPGHYQIAVRNYLDDGGDKYTQSAVTIKVELNPNTLSTPRFGFEARLMGGIAMGWNAYRSHLPPDGWLASDDDNPEVHGRIKIPIYKDWGSEFGFHFRDSRLRSSAKFNNGSNRDESFKDTQLYAGSTYKWKELGPTLPVLLKGFVFFEQKTPFTFNSDNFNYENVLEFYEQFWGISAAAEMKWFGWHPRWDLITEHRLDFYLFAQGSTFGQERPNFILPALRSEIYARRKIGSDMRFLLGTQLYLQHLSQIGENYESTRSLATISVKLGFELEL